jgi:hypothetical protein
MYPTGINDKSTYLRGYKYHQWFYWIKIGINKIVLIEKSRVIISQNFDLTCIRGGIT